MSFRDPREPKTETRLEQAERLAYEDERERRRLAPPTEYNYPGPDTPVANNLKDAYAMEKEAFRK